MTFREHETDGLDCWCAPTYQLPCDDCDDGCWKCGSKGYTLLTREEAELAEDPLVIVHNEQAP